MICVRQGGPPRYRFETFPETGLVHGAFTRLGGSSSRPYASLNVGYTVDDDPARVAANLQAVYAAMGVDEGAIVSGRQVHGNRVAVAGPDDGGRVFDETDALVTDSPGLLLLLRLADCAPVYLYDPERRVVGLAHAGWRGAVTRIASRTAQTMMTTYGCRPEEIIVGVGPAIGPCCFEVGPEVVEAFEGEFGDVPGLITRRQASGKGYVDLGLAVARQLADVGVTRVEQAGICTMCRRDEFFSHRGEGGVTGRFAAVIGLERT